MIYKGIELRSLEFFGGLGEPVKLDFTTGLNLVYGASNTGKSFALKALDFMLGGSGPLPNIPERKGYEVILLGLEIKGVGEYTILRSVAGGAYKLYSGLWQYSKLPIESTILQPTQRSSGEQSLAGWLLDYLGLAGRQLAKNQSGEKENFNFRELIPYILVDETSIQAERSPVETDIGPVKRPKERSVFRLLLTGIDDKSIVPVLNPVKFNAARSTKIEVVKDLLQEVEERLQADYPDVSDLQGQGERLDASLEKLRLELKFYQSNSLDLLNERNNLLREVSKKKDRADDVTLHLQRFYQLNSMYDSDIRRLESIEEASFLLSLEGSACASCGAPAEAQVIKRQSQEVLLDQSAAIAEINKIKLLQSELELTVNSLRVELHKITEGLPLDEERLDEIDLLLEAQTPEVGSCEVSLNDLLAEKYYVLKGLSLLNQKQEYLEKIAELEKAKAPGRKDRPNLDVPSSAIIDFCKVMSDVLIEWGFPGKNIITFDKENYDVAVDGKLRIDNGKGVRAITHAAFKVALLIYCRKNDLPHPGFIVFDSPLLTYRDPLKNPKMGALSADELALSKTSVKARFFEHLDKISDLGQFIVLENIDPPKDIEKISSVEVFYGSTGGGRYGLFPMLAAS